MRVHDERPDEEPDSGRDSGRDIDLLGADEVFGEMSLLDPGPRSASVTAVDDATLLRLGQEPFFELLAEYPEIGRHVMQLLTRRLRHLLSLA